MRLLSLPFIYLCTFLPNPVTPEPLSAGPPPPHPPVVVLETPFHLALHPPPGPSRAALHPAHPCFSPSSCRSRPVVQINASLHFEPSKINIFHRDCKRSGRDATCLAAFLCFTPVFLAPRYQTATVGKSGPSPLPPLQSLPEDFVFALFLNLGFC